MDLFDDLALLEGLLSDSDCEAYREKEQESEK